MILNCAHVNKLMDEVKDQRVNTSASSNRQLQVIDMSSDSESVEKLENPKVENPKMQKRKVDAREAYKSTWDAFVSRCLTFKGMMFELIHLCNGDNALFESVRLSVQAERYPNANTCNVKTF